MQVARKAAVYIDGYSLYYGLRETMTQALFLREVPEARVHELAGRYFPRPACQGHGIDARRGGRCADAPPCS